MIPMCPRRLRDHPRLPMTAFMNPSDIHNFSRDRLKVKDQNRIRYSPCVIASRGSSRPVPPGAVAARVPAAVGHLLFVCLTRCWRRRMRVGRPLGPAELPHYFPLEDPERSTIEEKLGTARCKGALSTPLLAIAGRKEPSLRAR